MKKVISVFLCLVFVFALFLELSGSDPDKKWSFRTYVEYVTENIEPFPKADMQLTWEDGDGIFERVGGFFTFLGDLIAYPFEVVGCVVNNAFVILSGFLPFTFGDFDKPVFDGIENEEVTP